MPITVTKSVGPGKDFATMQSFCTWLSNEPMVTNDEMVVAEVYYEIPNTEGFTVRAKTGEHDATHYCIVKPAPGLGYLDLNPLGGPYTWTNGGLLLNVKFPSATALFSSVTIREGAALRGFRIDMTGAANDNTTVCVGIMLGGTGNAGVKRYPEFTKNFVRSQTTGSASRLFTTGEYAIGGIVTENIFWQAAGNGLFGAINYGTTFERNTLVRTGTAAGTSATTGVDWTVKNNVYIGCGSVPAIGLPASATAQVVNNFTDTPMTGNAGGFTVLTAGTLLEDPINNVMPKAGGSLINKGNAAAYRTKDIRGYYRGTAPDAGAIQLTAQPLPPFATATITKQTVTDQTILIEGTTVGYDSSVTGNAVITKNGGTFVTSKTMTLSGNTFSVSFTINTGGTFDAPDIRLTNDAGQGPSATGGSAFTLVTPIMPVVGLTVQKLVGRKLTLTGTFDNKPLSGNISFPAAASNPSGAVTANTTNITFDYTNKKWSAVLSGITPGNYDPPLITLTNAAGTCQPANGAVAMTVTQFVPTPIAGINIQTIGLGQTFAHLGTFSTWLNTRDLVANNEIIYAYVTDDQTSVDWGSLNLNPKGWDNSHYCIVRPAPGMGVNELHKNDPFDYGILGVEIVNNLGSGATINGGVVLEGFRLKIKEPGAATNSVGWYLSNTDVNNGSAPATLRNCRIWTNGIDATNKCIGVGYGSGIGPAVMQVYNNLFVHEDGQAMSVGGSFQNTHNNTFARRGTAVGYKSLATGYLPVTIKDNLFIGCGGTPTSNNGTLPTAAGNITDTVLTTPIAGFTYATNVVVNATTDFTPAEGGGAINKASAASVSTKDIYGQNRGLAPDVGAKQLHAYVDVSTVTITSQSADGTSVTINGTATNNATTGHVTLSPAATNPSGAVVYGPADFTINADGSFSVTLPNVTPGNYAPPLLTASNPGGISLPAAGGAIQSVSIVRIGGNPMVADAMSLPGPVLTIDGLVLNGTNVNVNGTVSLQGDPSGTLQLYIDPLPSGPSKGPFPPNLNGGTWQYSATLTDYSANIRVVAVANNTPQVATSPVAIVKAAGSPALPLK
jgi:hypothetical protein